MDLESAADDLYAGSPDDFVAHRKELVAQARQAKDRELATQIGQLRRPTRTGWLVNVLAREAPDEVAALLELGAELARAQQRKSGDDLRRLSKDRRTAVDGLAKKAVALGRERGYEAPDSGVQEVAQTLQSALGDPQVAELVRRGHLTQAASYGGFGPGDLTAALAASMPDASPARGSEAEVEPEEPAEPAAQDDGRRRELEEQAAAARTAWEEAQAEVETAEADAERATQEADDLADRVEALRTELRETEEAEREARSNARATRKRSTELRQAAATAERAATDAAAAVTTR